MALTALVWLQASTDLNFSGSQLWIGDWRFPECFHLCKRNHSPRGMVRFAGTSGLCLLVDFKSLAFAAKWLALFWMYFGKRHEVVSSKESKVVTSNPRILDLWVFCSLGLSAQPRLCNETFAS
eukprot:671906-Amphidinium_carterae.1